VTVVTSATPSLLDAVTLRAFAREDALTLEGGQPEGAVIGLTALIGEEIVAYGGLSKMEGRHWGFFLVSESESGQLLRTRAPRFLHRLAVRMVRIFDATGIAEIVALCDERQVRAAEWLAALGFRIMPDDGKPADIAAFEAARGGCKTWIRRAA
jgi:hypothetical protein